MKKSIGKHSNFLTKKLPLLSAILLCILYLPLKAQDSSYSNYVKQHKEKIIIGGDNSFTFFDKAFYQNQVFFVSESHGYEKPQELDFEIFKQINKKTGLRIYLAEIDFSQAYYLNKYLTTGNEELLQSIYQYWYNQQLQWGCKAGFDKWKKLYAYNQTLPAGKKIRVLGLDGAQDLNMNVQLLLELLQTAEDQPVKKSFDSLTTYSKMKLANKNEKKMFISYARRLDSTMLSNTTLFKKLLKANYYSVQFIIHNIASKEVREKKIIDNFTSLYFQYKLGNEKMYGFWGRFHAMQDSVNNSMPFAGLLKKSQLPMRNKIVTIPIFCLESSSMLPTSFLPPMAQQKGTVYSKSSMVNDDSFIYQVAGISVFKSLIEKNSCYIFKLNAANSPYKKGLYLLESSCKMDKSFEWIGNKKLATTDYFQYAIIVSNSDWAGPYGDNKAEKSL